MIGAKTELQVPSEFYNWMRRAYVAEMTAAIRRLVDWDSRSISLVRLMEEIADHPEVISRRRYAGSYRSSLLAVLRSHAFDRLAGPDGRQIDRRLIQKGRRNLLAAQRRLRVFVNKHVAHRARYPMRRLPAFDDLDACVDLLETIAEEYHLLMEGKALSPVVPVIQYDWKRPFRIAWL
jgi:hypothetical protein